MFVRYPVFLPISRVRSPDRNLNRSWCRRMIFAKSLCRTIHPLSRSRGVGGGRRGRDVGNRSGVFCNQFFGRQRAILRRARIYFATVTCILPRDRGVVLLLGESNRAPALLSIPPLNFADLLLLSTRSNIYARKYSDYTTIARRQIIKSRMRANRA